MMKLRGTVAGGAGTPSSSSTMTSSSTSSHGGRRTGRNGAIKCIFLAAILALAAILILAETSSLANFTQRLASRSAISSSKETTTTTPSSSYIPATSEAYLQEHAQELGLTATSYETAGSSCQIWKNSNEASNPLFQPLAQYRQELAEYNRVQSEYNTIPITVARNLVRELKPDDPIHNENVCRSVDLFRGGLDGGDVFNSSRSSTNTNVVRPHPLSYGDTFGYIEPLLPPLRHPDYCFRQSAKEVGDLSYLIHDFGALCRKLTPHSKVILIDLGASLNFRNNASMHVVQLAALYRKFGFVFDHIYAFEKTPLDPQLVFEKVPLDWLPSYHWINVGVESDPTSRFHPFETLLQTFTQDDFVVVKLDVDNPSVELPLAMQLLQDERYHKLVDVFYFEKHVVLKEMKGWWGSAVEGSVLDAIQLFSALRQKGIAAHTWI